MRDDVRTLMESQIAELVDALAGMVYQHCGPENEAGEWNTGALSANADAVDLLERFNRVRLIRGYGRMLVFRWKDTPAPGAEGETR